MEDLEAFYREIDSKNLIDNSLGLDINSLYLEGIEKIKDNDFEKAVLLNREREAIQFVKTTDEGLLPQMTGVSKTEQGEEIPIEWPDKNNFLPKDYEHIRWRFETTKNKYIKIELGLFLFYSEFLKSNIEIKVLLNLLFDLSLEQLNKSKTEEKNNYLSDYNHVLKHLVYISNKRKNNRDIGSILNKACEFIYKEHLTWMFSYYGTIRFILDSTKIIKDYFQSFESHNLSAVMDKNWEAVIYEADSNPWGAIYISDATYELAKKIADNRYDWKFIKAKQYEKLAEEAKTTNALSEVTFIEKALRIYQEIKKPADIERLAKKYQDRRDKINLGEINYTLPEEETKQIYDNIIRLVNEYSKEQIVLNICFTPMISTVKIIQELNQANSKENFLSNIIPVNIQDKFGNTIEKYDSKDEKEEYAFLQLYGNSLQIGTQALVQLILEAVRLEKIHANTVIDFLEKTWIGEGGSRIINGKECAIDYLAILKPGISLLFGELEKWSKDNSYSPDFVCATDSLTLKVEYILREICLKIGIVTFKQRKDKSGVVMEKLLDDIIRDLKNYLDEDDYYFLKFIMTDKAGENLRNRVAHGLLDNVEYGIQYPILVLSVILKLSNYTFSSNELNHSLI